jgi:hypothetical protein
MIYGVAANGTQVIAAGIIVVPKPARSSIYTTTLCPPMRRTFAIHEQPGSDLGIAINGSNIR